MTERRQDLVGVRWRPFVDVLDGRVTVRAQRSQELVAPIRRLLRSSVVVRADNHECSHVVSPPTLAKGAAESRRRPKPIRWGAAGCVAASRSKQPCWAR